MPNGGLRAANVLRCVAGACQVEPAPIVVPLADTMATPIDLLSPRSGEVLAASTELRFALAGPVDASAIFLNVLDSVPTSIAASLESVVWTATLAPGANSAMHVDGRGVVGGTIVGTATDLPTGQALYAVAYGVRGGRVVALSPLVPFAVGTAPWASIGDACSDVGELPTVDCASPAEPLVCTVDGCARICASDADCRRAGMVGCDLPSSTVAVRTCF